MGEAEESAGGRSMKADNAGRKKIKLLTCRRNISLAIIDDVPWLRVQRLYIKKRMNAVTTSDDGSLIHTVALQGSSV